MFASCNGGGNVGKPVIKLTYFGIEGAAEKVRLALTLQGLEFEDKRITFPEWNALKSSTPYGQLPVMEVDGKMITQSDAMMKWAGRFNNKALYPDDLALDIDEVLGLLGDLVRAFQPSQGIGFGGKNMGYDFADDEAGKANKTAKTKEIREKFHAEELPKYMGFFTKILQERGEKFFCGSKVTIADCAIFVQLRYFLRGVADFIPKTCIEPYPVVMAWNDRMMNIPQIKAWYEAHPV